MTTDAVRFWFRGEVVELRDVRPTQSVLHWLREDGRSRGTKEGCNQGDCGACTVVLVERGPDGPRARTANACLLLVPMLHGRGLLTVEDVADDGALHPVQAAMVEHGGSQCGFCTPGFVMSMWCTAERCAAAGHEADRDELTASLTGNLCRCTGYRPIVDAAIDATVAAVASGRSRLDAPFLTSVLDAVGQPEPLALAHGSASYAAPSDEASLTDALVAQPGARLVSGGTDLVLALRLSGDELRDDVALVSTDLVDGLGTIAEADGSLRIGAAARLEDGWAALVARAPSLARMAERFAGPAVRSRGTVGGNLANASPIADLVPVLVALDAVAIVHGPGGERAVPVEGFATGVRRTVLEPGEHLARVDVPLASFERVLRAHKVSRRFDDDISTVSLVAALVLDHGRIDDVRVVLGGMATTVRRATGVEQVLRDRRWNHDALVIAQAALGAELSPIDDHRASASYRTRAARGLLERWWYETGADAPRADVDVWGAR